MSDRSEDTPAQAEFRAAARAFLTNHAEPRSTVDLWQVAGLPHDDEARTYFESGRSWQRKLAKNGWAGLTWPTDFGGGGHPPWSDRIFREESDNYGSNPGFVGATISMLGPTLLAHASEELKVRFLPSLISGETAWCQLFSEPSAGSDLASLATRAVLDGEHWVVDGQKVWNSCAQFADWGFLLARTNPDATKHQGITFLLVDMTSPGIEVRPLIQANGSSHFNEVFLSSVRIPINQVVGEINGGWTPTRTVLANEAAFIGRGGGAPASERLLNLAAQHNSLDDPTVRQRLARIISRERLQNLMGQRVQSAIRGGQHPPFDPALTKVLAAGTKVLTGELAAELAGPAAVAGPQTGNREGIWIQSELLNRFAISIGGGTTEVQKNNLAERSLGLPREPETNRGVSWKDVPRS
ncbi:MAG: acyl-CoA dehydrogenase family protein [Acidimicrobiales bacterium]|nr:acyl-CoA dehydrogenase family protein [Acidimicrobiales bacterium]